MNVVCISRATLPFQPPQPTSVYNGPAILSANLTSSSQPSVSRRRALADTSADDSIASWMVVYKSDISAAYVKGFCAENITALGLSCGNIYTSTLLGFSCQVPSTECDKLNDTASESPWLRACVCVCLWVGGGGGGGGGRTLPCLPQVLMGFKVVYTSA